MSRKNFSRAHSRAIFAGQVWIVRIPMCEPRGRQEEMSMRVMAVAEGYAMCRLRNAVPFIQAVTNWDPEWRLASSADEERVKP